MEGLKDIYFIHPEESKKKGYFVTERTKDRQTVRVHYKPYSILSVKNQRKIKQFPNKSIWEITEIRELADKSNVVEVPPENFQEFDDVAFVWKHPELNELSVIPDTLAQNRIIGYTKLVEINKILKRGLDAHQRKYQEIFEDMEEYKSLQKRINAELACNRDRIQETMSEIQNIKKQATDLSSKSEYYRAKVQAMLDQEVDGRALVNQSAKMWASFRDLVDLLGERANLSERRLQGTADIGVLTAKHEELEKKIEHAMEHLGSQEKALSELSEQKEKPKEKPKEEEKEVGKSGFERRRAGATDED